MIRKNNFLFLGIVVLVISLVATSGCTSNTQNNTPQKSTIQNSNFTDGSISFQYPSDFTNTTKPTDIASGDSHWINVGFLANSNNLDIIVNKYPNVPTSYTPQSIAQSTLDIRKQLNGSAVLSSIRQTNPNGLDMWETISTVINPNDGSTVIYYETTFKKGNNMYIIDAYGDKNNQKDIQKVADIVFNSIK